MTHHLVGMAEVAEMLGVSRQRVAQLITSYDDFPSPEVELAGGRIWSRTAVETWISSHPERGGGEDREQGGPLSALKRLGRKAATGMFTRFSDAARDVVARAQEEARLLRHDYIGTEHLLLGILRQGGLAAHVLDSMGVTTDGVREAIRSKVGEGETIPKGHIAFTPRSKQALEGALRSAQELEHERIVPEDVLLALLSMDEGMAHDILTETSSVDPVMARKRILANLPRFAPVLPAPPDPGTGDPDPLSCSFCGKARSRVEKLIAGAGVYICDGCVRLSAEIVDESDDVPVGPGIDHAALQALQREVESLSERLADALHRFEDPDS